MQNKFALKDFILLVLVSLTLVGEFLSMRQDDRRWKQNEDIQETIGDIEQLFSWLESKHDYTRVVSGSPNNDGSTQDTQTQLRYGAR